MIDMIVYFLVLIFSVVVHEWVHGFVAWKLGDETAYRAGRLSLNPWVHLDLVGSFLVPGLAILLGSGMLIGWAKPVPIQPLYFRRPLTDMMWVAIAGPASNFLMAFIAIGLLGMGLRGGWSGFVLEKMVVLNIILGCFNLIPIPPLDGSRVLRAFLPARGRSFLDRIEPYGFLIVLILAYMGILSHILVWMIGPFMVYTNAFLSR